MATTFVDGTTPLDAAAMNGIEDEIADVSDSVDTLAGRTPNISTGNRTSISSGDDLNNYTNVGSYLVNGNSIATSLENCPSQTAFALWVIAIDGTYRIQFLMNRTGVIYTRYYSGSSFGDWCRLDRTAV